MTLILFGCVKNNPDPAWIEILPFTLEANPNLPNESPHLNHNFSNAWVYVDNEIVGVFELPVKIPVLKEGAKEIRIYPAILNNGISATKKIYPFVEAYATTADLQKNGTVTIQPVTRYKDATKFWIEDFEDQAPLIQSSSTSMVDLVVVSDNSILDPSINGGSFGRILLNSTNHTYSASTTANANGTLNMALPIGKDVYLEIDYHTTNSLVTGVLAISDNGIQDNVNVQINAQDPSTISWKKIYIQLDEIVSYYATANRFEFSLNAILEEGQTATEINIDNIKAVYF